MVLIARGLIAIIIEALVSCFSRFFFFSTVLCRVFVVLSSSQISDIPCVVTVSSDSLFR